MPRRYSPEDDEYRRHKVRQRIKGRNTCLGCLLLLVLVPAAAITSIWLGVRSGAFTVPESRPTGPRPVADDAIQDDRAKLIGEFQGLGLIQKAEVTKDGAELWIAPRFYTLDYDDKVRTANVVWAWAFAVPKNGTAGHAVGDLYLYDSKSGKLIGSYSGTQGLHWDP